jgi:ribosomal biogenesis protein LAS1
MWLFAYKHIHTSCVTCTTLSSPSVMNSKPSRIVPWRDWQEWQDVGQGLFSEDEAHMRTALSRVSAWRARGKVPLSVDSIAQLVELRIHEGRGQSRAAGNTKRSSIEMQLM